MEGTPQENAAQETGSSLSRALREQRCAATVFEERARKTDMGDVRDCSVFSLEPLQRVKWKHVGHTPVIRKYEKDRSEWDWPPPPTTTGCSNPDSLGLGSLTQHRRPGVST